MPGTTGTPSFWAVLRAAILLPTARIVSGPGPMNLTPALAHASEKSAFSERKP
jgi:hypothetical protein